MHLILLLYAFNLITFNRAEENDVANFDDNQAYNKHKLYRQFLSYLNLKDKSPILPKYFHFSRFDSNFSLDFPSQNSSKCLRDISYTFENFGNLSNQWALRILDSFAKPASGFLQGNFLWVGEYNECIKVYAPPKASDSTTGNFNGQYCTLSYMLPFSNYSLPLKFGICLPDSCSSTDLLDEIKLLLLKTGRFPAFDLASSSMSMPVSIVCQPRVRHLNVAAKSFIAMVSVFFIFTFLGSSITVVKYFKQLLQEQNKSSLIINGFNQGSSIVDQDGLLKNSVDLNNRQQRDTSTNKGFLGKCEKFLSSFCVFTNGDKLLNTDSSEGQLLCIHGIRFFSMSWVILGHTYAAVFETLRNKMETFNTVKDDFYFQVISQGFFSVDSFFVLSGFLLTYLAMKEFSKTKGSINWIYFYIHRYIRLTPLYMMVLGFSTTVYFYLGSGPFWPVGDYDPVCSKNWWWNLLYINNLADQNKQCMTWSWYLANDMQFFVISPLFLITLCRWPKVGYSLVGIFTFATVLCNFVLTYQYDIVVGIVSFLTGETFDFTEVTLKYQEYFQKIYIKPYTRIGPYLVGITLGHILFKHKTSNRPKMNLVFLCVGWIVASAVTLTVVYGLYHSDFSLVARCFYNALSRICFALGLSWVIYVCLTNQGGIVNSFLSYKLFIPLSRLTYCAYLIHPLIIIGYYNALKMPVEFSHSSMVLMFLGFMVVTYILSLPVSLILESPIVSLEKMIRSNFSKGQKTESSS